MLLTCIANCVTLAFLHKNTLPYLPHLHLIISMLNFGVDESTGFSIIQHLKQHDTLFSSLQIALQSRALFKLVHPIPGNASYCTTYPPLLGKAFIIDVNSNSLKEGYVYKQMDSVCVAVIFGLLAINILSYWETAYVFKALLVNRKYYLIFLLSLVNWAVGDTGTNINCIYSSSEDLLK